MDSRLKDILKQTYVDNYSSVYVCLFHRALMTYQVLQIVSNVAQTSFYSIHIIIHNTSVRYNYKQDYKAINNLKLKEKLLRSATLS